MERQYTVALVGPHGLSKDEQIAAEVRFITELEKLLGGPDEVVREYWNHIEPPQPSIETALTRAKSAATVAAWGPGPMPDSVHFALIMEEPVQTATQWPANGSNVPF
jgi:hypothetical protein